MRSVDKMRDYGHQCCARIDDAIHDYCDEIEREIAETEAFCRRVEEAARNNDELDVFGVAYMPLPVDADGVPVRIGDVMEFAYDPPQDQPIFEVSGFDAKGALFYVPRGEIRARKTTTASVVRHHNPRTLEDVMHDVMQFGHDDNTVGERADWVIAKYAAEIRELMGGDA